MRLFFKAIEQFTEIWAKDMLLCTRWKQSGRREFPVQKLITASFNGLQNVRFYMELFRCKNGWNWLFIKTMELDSKKMICYIEIPGRMLPFLMKEMREMEQSCLAANSNEKEGYKETVVKSKEELKKELAHIEEQLLTDVDKPLPLYSKEAGVNITVGKDFLQRLQSSRKQTKDEGMDDEFFTLFDEKRS